MKKFFFFVLIFFLFSHKGYCHLSLGIRDTYYIRLGYLYKEKWNITIENSVYFEHFDYQKLRLTMGYSRNMKYFVCKIDAYVSSLWNIEYQDFGLWCDVSVPILELCRMDMVINPHYDTQCGYITCYSLGTTLRLNNSFDLGVKYTTLPEYRMSEKRIRLGLVIKEANLWVKPEISISADRLKNARILCGFGYRL